MTTALPPVYAVVEIHISVKLKVIFEGIPIHLGLLLI
jgi:hypothetical protein